MKKIIVMLLVINILLLSLTGCCIKHDWEGPTCYSSKTCLNCGKTEGQYLPHSFKEATIYEPETCTECGLQRGDKLTPVREWGFNNLSEMGNALIEITEYHLSDANNAYVVATGAIKFENGYMLNWNFDIENGKCVFKETSDPRQFKIVNNDNLDIDNGWYAYNIKERKTSTSRENFVVIVERHSTGISYPESWYIPYSLIDWERNAELKPGSDNEYILYLLNN